MCQRALAGLLMLVALSSWALADNLIRVWYASGTYEVNPNARTVLITSGGTFKVQATDGGDLGINRSITIAEGVTGTVDLYILRNPEDANDPNGPEYDSLNPWGALDVGMIGFTSATPPEGLTINLAEIRVLGSLGPDAEDSPTRATNVTGLSKIGFSVEKDVYLDDLPAGGKFETQSLNCNLHVTGSNDNGGEIHVAYFLAPYAIVVSGNLTGGVYIGECGCASGMSGHLDLRGDARLVAVHTRMAEAGLIDIAGSVLEALWITGDVDPNAGIHVAGDLRPYAFFTVGADLSGSAQIDGDVLQATLIHIGNDWAGGISGSLVVGGALVGDLYAKDGIPSGGALEIHGGLGGSIYLASHLLGSLVITGDPRVSISGDIDVVGNVGGYLQTHAVRKLWVHGGVTNDPSGDPRVKVIGDIGLLDPNSTVSTTLVVNGPLNGGVHVTGSVGPSGGLFLVAGIGVDDPGWVQIDGDVLGLLQITRSVNPNPERSPVWIQGNVGSELCAGTVSIGPYGQMLGPVQIDGAIFGATPQGGSLVDIRSAIDGAGALLVGGDVGGTIALEGAVVARPDPNEPRITIGGDVSGLMYASDSFGGLVVINQDVAASGTLRFDAGTTGDAGVRINELGGAVKVFGECKADVYVASIGGAGQFWTDTAFPATVWVAGEVVPRDDPNVPAIVVGGDLTGEIHAGRLAGDVNVDGSVGATGVVAIDGELAYGATLSVGGDFAGAAAVGENCGGAIHVGGSLLGPIDVFGYLGDVHQPTDFAGHIRVNGGFALRGGHARPRLDSPGVPGFGPARERPQFLFHR